MEPVLRFSFFILPEVVLLRMDADDVDLICCFIFEDDAALLMTWLVIAELSPSAADDSFAFVLLID